MTILERIEKAKKLEEMETPFAVRRIVGNVIISGSQLALQTSDSDFVTVKEFRGALKWLVEQLGGTVEWPKEALGEKAKRVGP